jgi:hypothetical protein
VIPSIIPDKDLCDFCNAEDPPFMYAGPRIWSEVFRMIFEAGYWAACPACADLHERGEHLLLAQSSCFIASCRPSNRPIIARELARIYPLFSRKREAYVRHATARHAI